MLPPTKGLADLSLGKEMPRRSQRVSQRQAAASPGPDPDPDSGDAAESSSAVAVIEAASGVSYRVNDYTDKSRSRAEVGLHNVDVKLRQAIPQTKDGSSYLAFEFTDQFSIRVGDAGSTHATPTCTCGANEDGVPCKVCRWFWVAGGACALTWHSICTGSSIKSCPQSHLRVSCPYRQTCTPSENPH